MNCFSLSRFALVILILLIVAWAYYAYVVEMCIIWSENICQKIFYIIIFHILVVLFLFPYFKAVMVDSIPVPFEFYLNSDEHAASLDLTSDRDKWRRFLEELIAKKNLTIYTRDFGSNVRFCSICQLIKPDRAHHCSLCNRCLLRMDHHCPWVGNCVGYHNHKFFIQFLGYGSLFCLFVAASSIEFAISWWKVEQTKNLRGINFLILLVIAVMFFLVQFSLCSYHIYLTMKNMTTLESMRKSVFQDPEIISFDLGIMENLRELLGERIIDWFLPTQTSRGDGIVYPVKRKLTAYDSI